jgi:Fic family protein
MKLPRTPPDLDGLVSGWIKSKRISAIFELAERLDPNEVYKHWDILRHVPARKGYTHEEWWAAIKMKRRAAYRTVSLRDKDGKSFVYFITDEVQRLIHEIDVGAGRFIGMSDPIANPQTRDRYVINSLIHEAITSSQLEGAVSTVEVAKEMIRTGRPPMDRSERMILNNYQTMRHIAEIKDHPLTPELILDLHRRITENTLDHSSAAGRCRTADEPVQVKSAEGVVYHDPPPADELEYRMQQMCDFANGKTPAQFLPPVVRSIILHFWLAYDHPFVDGNGRTARALFYWSMLHHGYWLFEFISISSILRQAHTQYARSFLHTESDDNDLNYFIIYQAEVIHRAITELHRYIDRKTRELKETEARMRFLRHLNHRQQALIQHALRHPNQEYTVESHRRSHNTAYDTARTDLLALVKLHLLRKGQRGKAMIFEPAPDLKKQLETLAD